MPECTTANAVTVTYDAALTATGAPIVRCRRDDVVIEFTPAGARELGAGLIEAAATAELESWVFRYAADVMAMPAADARRFAASLAAQLAADLPPVSDG